MNEADLYIIFAILGYLIGLIIAKVLKNKKYVVKNE